MIAPIQQPPEMQPPTNLARARHLVANMLLRQPRRRFVQPAGVAPWKAWLVAGWVAVAAAAYAAHLLGWL